MGGGIGGVEGNGLAQVRRPQVGPAGLARDQPQVIQRRRMPGLGLQDQAVEPLGLSEVARLVVLHRQRHGFGDGCHACRFTTPRNGR